MATGGFAFVPVNPAVRESPSHKPMGFDPAKSYSMTQEPIELNVTAPACAFQAAVATSVEQLAPLAM